MTDLGKFSTEELVDDYFASKMDADACERVAPDRFRERIETNRRIMTLIEKELEQRDELERIQ